MKKIILTLFFFLSFHNLISGQQIAKIEDGTWSDVNVDHEFNNRKLEVPKTKNWDKIISHTGYTLAYNEKYKQANWVAYELTKEETRKTVERSNKFISDPQIYSVNNFDKDYKRSGYDRGHLAPAADMGWSTATMRESFYYSNMSPQTPGFNRGIWKKLEELVRTWAIENEAVYIVTGPILTNGLPTIGNNKVAVPNYYYKVILDYQKPNIKGIGFILPNESAKSLLQNYAVSIDSVEKATGLDFFYLLNDQDENLIEKEFCINCWSWSSVNISAEKNENKVSVTVQCTGTTKAGNRCKRMTTNANGKCYQH